MKAKHCSAEVLQSLPNTNRKTVLDILLEKDVCILACGSLSCLRGLYKACAQRGELHRFRPCYITNREYALGMGESILLSKIRKLLAEEKISGIILYVSCTEVITGCDYTGILQRLGDTGGVPVRPFFRGPLVSGRGQLADTARRLVADLPEAGKPRGVPSLPVPAVDFDGIYEQASRWNLQCVLLSPGGCSACMTRISEGNGVLTRFDGTFAGSPDWKGLGDRARALCDSEPLLLKTAISAMLLPPGTENMVREAPKVAPCSGWHSAAQGLSDYLLGEMRRWAEKCTRRAQECCHLGYSRLLCPQKDPGVDAAWSPDRMALPEKMLVCSSAGLAAAQYLWENRRIPYAVDALLPPELVDRLVGELKGMPGKRICVTGDPIVVNSLCTAFSQRDPEWEVTKLLYCPVKSDRSFYREFSDFLLCSNEEELAAALNGRDAFVADAVFAAWLQAKVPGCRLVSLPYPAMGIYSF